MEALTLGDRGRKPTRNNSRRANSRAISKYRSGKIACYHCGKLGHIKPNIIGY